MKGGNHRSPGGVCAARKLLSLEFGGKLENFHRIPWDTNLLLEQGEIYP